MNISITTVINSHQHKSVHGVTITWNRKTMPGAREERTMFHQTVPFSLFLEVREQHSCYSHSCTHRIITMQISLPHISHSLASSLVKAVVVEVVGGSHLCNALLHTRICPCHERVLQFLNLSGVLGSVFDLFHLWRRPQNKPFQQRTGPGKCWHFHG